MVQLGLHRIAEEGAKMYVICRPDGHDLLDALVSCLRNGVSIVVDGEIQTEESLKGSCLMREESGYKAECILNEMGELTGLCFTENQPRNTLLPSYYTNHKG